MKKTMILLCAALQLCACGGRFKQNLNVASAMDSSPDNMDIADTTDRLWYESCDYVPDTVVGRFIEPNRVDTLLFRLYSEKECRYIDRAPYNVSIWDYIDWMQERDAVIRVETTDGRIVHTEIDRTGVCRAVALDGLVQGTDALAIVWFTMQISNIEMCHVVTIANGQWREIGSFDVNTFTLPDSTHVEHGIEGVLEKRKGEWMYRSYEDQMQWYEDHDSGDCPMKLLKSILHVMP